MATFNCAYDNPSYNIRQMESGGEAGGGATTQYAKFAAFTAMQAYAATLTVTTAGTNAGHGFATLKISGTATTTLALTTLGTAVAGTTTNVLLTTATGGVSLLAGDVMAFASLVDASGKAATAIELSVTKGANFTQ